jgi:hypothetical protein
MLANARIGSKTAQMMFAIARIMFAIFQIIFAIDFAPSSVCRVMLAIPQTAS